MTIFSNTQFLYTKFTFQAKNSVKLSSEKWSPILTEETRPEELQMQSHVNNQSIVDTDVQNVQMQENSNISNEETLSKYILKLSSLKLNTYVNLYKH